MRFQVCTFQKQQTKQQTNCIFDVNSMQIRCDFHHPNNKQNITENTVLVYVNGL